LVHPAPTLSFRSKPAANHSVEYAVLSQTTNPVRVTHANLHDCEDCIQGEYVTATDNYIHDVEVAFPKPTSTASNATPTRAAT
jgi:hypothetical protein